MKNYRRTIIGTLVAGLIFGGNFIHSYANTNTVSLKDILENSNKTVEEILAIPGLVQILSHEKDFKPSDTTEGIGGIYYGYPMFNQHTVIAFVNWIMEQDEVYRDLFGNDEVKSLDVIVGTDKFDELWKQASDIDEYKFTLLQQTYVQNTIVEPGIERLKQKIGIDISENRGLSEAFYNTAVEFGVIGTEKIFEELLSDCSDIKDVEFDKFLKDYYNAKKSKINKLKSISTKEDIKNSLLKNLDKEIKDLKDIYIRSTDIKVVNTDSDTLTKKEEVQDSKTKIDLQKSEKKSFNPFKSVSDFISNLFK